MFFSWDGIVEGLKTINIGWSSVQAANKVKKYLNNKTRNTKLAEDRINPIFENLLEDTSNQVLNTLFSNKTESSSLKPIKAANEHLRNALNFRRERKWNLQNEQLDLARAKYTEGSADLKDSRFALATLGVYCLYMIGECHKIQGDNEAMFSYRQRATKFLAEIIELKINNDFKRMDNSLMIVSGLNIFGFALASGIGVAVSPMLLLAGTSNGAMISVFSVLDRGKPKIKIRNKKRQRILSSCMPHFQCTVRELKEALDS